MRSLWIGLGGALGCVARYRMDGWVANRLGAAFPYGTLAVNLLGSFLLALLMSAGLRTDIMPPTLRIALGSGVLGGFTTYSTFSYETLRYIQSGAWSVAALNVALTLLGALGAAALGWAAGQALLST